MPLVETAQHVWSLVVSPTLPTPFNYVPLFFRVMAILIAAPFAVFMALELVAYVIMRTLHISMSNLRVPRSPLDERRELVEGEGEGEEEEESGEIAARVGAAYRSPTPSSEKSQPFSRSFGAAAPSATTTAASVLVLAALVAVFATGFHFLVTHQNALAAARMAGASTNPTAFSVPTAVILTAHPDDEAMFFAPTVLNLVAAGWSVLPVCISAGNAAGLGPIRTLELTESYKRLGASGVLLIDDPALPDSMGPDGAWDPALVAGLVAPHLNKIKPSHLVTFDTEGVTWHPNHVALASVAPYLEPLLDLDHSLVVLHLASPPLATKFTGALWAVFIAARDALRRNPPTGVTFVATPSQYVTALHAMRAHVSQLVWFRWLYVAFSRLMWVNQLQA